MSKDWTKDPRPFSDCLVAWTKHNRLTREEAANQLRIPLRAYNGWAYEGTACRFERSLRLLMSLLDYIDEHSIGTKPKEQT